MPAGRASRSSITTQRAPRPSRARALPSPSAAAPMVVEATGPNGAVVTFPSLTATDAVDGSDPVLSAPGSGTSFGLGTATVTCTATDAHGNVTTQTFQVTVQDMTPPTIDATDVT